MFCIRIIYDSIAVERLAEPLAKGDDRFSWFPLKKPESASSNPDSQSTPGETRRFAWLGDGSRVNQSLFHGTGS
jgi:hypothetical protein